MRLSSIVLAVSATLFAALPLLPAAPAIESNCDYLVQDEYEDECYTVLRTVWGPSEGAVTSTYCLVTGEPWDGRTCSRPGVLGIVQQTTCGALGREPDVFWDLCLLP